MGPYLLSMKAEGLKKGPEQTPAKEKAMLLMKYYDDFGIRENFETSERTTKIRVLRTKEKVKKLNLEHVTLFS
ncbi:MAG: hypothetical protein ACI8UX_001302 [Psychromonas sp.]|jgi:hypothetical protein